MKPRSELERVTVRLLLRYRHRYYSLISDYVLIKNPTNNHGEIIGSRPLR